MALLLHGANPAGSVLFADEGSGTPNPFKVYESELQGTDADIILEARQSISTSGNFGVNTLAG